MAHDKRWRLICYDIREPKRWRRVYRLLRGAGRPVQYSIFRARLDERELEKLRWDLGRVLAPEDALLVIDLCPMCATRVVSRNHVEGWTADEPTFLIWPPVAAPTPAGPTQAPAGGGEVESRAVRKSAGTRRRSAKAAARGA